MDIHHVIRLLADRVSECNEFDCWLLAQILIKEATKQGKVGTAEAHIKNDVEALQRSVRDTVADAQIPEGAPVNMVVPGLLQRRNVTYTQVYMPAAEEVPAMVAMLNERHAEMWRRCGLPNPSDAYSEQTYSEQTAENRR